MMLLCFFSFPGCSSLSSCTVGCLGSCVSFLLKCFSLTPMCILAPKISQLFMYLYLSIFSVSEIHLISTESLLLSEYGLFPQSFLQSFYSFVFICLIRFDANQDTMIFISGFYQQIHLLKIFIQIIYQKSLGCSFVTYFASGQLFQCQVLKRILFFPVTNSRSCVFPLTANLSSHSFEHKLFPPSLLLIYLLTVFSVSI